MKLQFDLLNLMIAAIVVCILAGCGQAIYDRGYQDAKTDYKKSDETIVNLALAAIKEEEQRLMRMGTALKHREIRLIERERREIVIPERQPLFTKPRQVVPRAPRF